MTRYGREVERLGRTYGRVRAAPLLELRRLLTETQAGPAVFVGSGGALAVAALAADLHRATAWHHATVATPLELLAQPPRGDANWVIFSAGARHPDTALAVDLALSMGRDVAVVTRQDIDRIPDRVARPGVHIVCVPSSKDGFLATNSVLSMAASMCSAYGWDLPEELPWLASERKDELETLRSAALVLWGPRHLAVALDLEARLAETALVWVQYADYRNFAHGRHAGFARRSDETSVVSIVAKGYRPLAERTVALLPAGTHHIELSSELEFPYSVLDLLVASIRLVEPRAAQEAIDPARPGVPAFGRKLYHLDASRLLSIDRDPPVERKLAAIGLGVRHSDVVRKALNGWIHDIQEQRFSAIVLDYDGTCCLTEQRFEPPPKQVIDELVRLLQRGMVVGFASGRGRSLSEEIRDWVPRKFWDQVTIALYNGTVILKPGSPVDDYSEPSALMESIVDRLREMATLGTVTIEARRTQVSVSCPGLTGSQLLPSVEALLARSDETDVRVAASAHSVDVTANVGTKGSLVQVLGERSGGSVLAIGDQGHPGGNDFDLLAATPWSLSVDQCSADLTRCWNLSRGNRSGPGLLLEYLSALRGEESPLLFEWH